MAVSMCSVTSQRDPSPATSGSEFLKRPLSSDMETELERAVKMKCSSGGRRKQSKPIRVRSELNPSPVEDLVVLQATQSPADLGVPPAEPCREEPPLTFDPAEVENSAIFPTKYHQLGSELQQEVTSYEDGSGGPSDDVDDDKNQSAESQPRVDSPSHDRSNFTTDTKPWNEFADSFYQSSQGIQSSDCLPTNLSMRSSLKTESPVGGDAYPVQGRSGASDPDSVSRLEILESERYWDGSDSGMEKSARIFHPDAYCDICDREFCNKYFLKTHRANKHGIYDGSSSDPGGGFATLGGGFSSSAPVPPAMSGLVFSQAGLETSPTVSEHNTSSSVSSGSSLSAVLPVPSLPASLGVLPFEDPGPAPVPPRATDMEDYCDICQKHFCNKYYLRKHRQDVHGIVPNESTASRRTQSEFSRASSDIPESLGPHFPLRSSSSVSTSTLPPPSALSNFPMFLPPPFGAPLPPVVPPFLPGAAGLGFGSLPFDGANSSKLATSSPSQAQSAETSSLAAGMMGADTYMNLFSKKLLSGYLVNNGDRDITAALAALAAAAASGADPSGVPGRLGPIPTTSEPSAPVTPSNPIPDTFAEMLQRIGARIGKKPDGVGGLHPDLFRLNGLGPGPVRSLASTPSSASSSSRLVDRVVCEICNKEVCNKYFLKTHKMKVHGWDPNTSTVPAVTVQSSSAVVTAEYSIKSEPPLSSTQPPPPPPLMYLPSLPDKPALFPPPDGLTPKDVELQKMGIDPEAYCEICRKEFCSKYFLRTHRQNIHGIQDASSSSPPGPYQPPAGSTAPMFSSSSQPFSSVVLPPLPPTPLSLPPTSMSAANCLPSSTSSSMFLSTTFSTLDTSVPGDGQLLNDQKPWKWKEPVNATRVSCTLCNKVLCNKYFLRTHMAKRHGVTVDTRLLPPPPPPVRDLIQSPTTNGLLQLGTPGSQIGPPALPASQLGLPGPGERDGADSDLEGSTDGGKVGAVNLVLSGRSSADVQTVTARTWQVPADETAVQSEGSEPGGPAVDSTVKCPLCAAAMPDHDSLLRHLSSVHHVDEQISMSLVHRPHTSSLHGVMRRRRQFRCSYCRERFRTRVHCELHARAAHPRATGSCVELTPAVETTSPPSTVPTAVHATPLDPNDAAAAQMLPYILRESTSDETDRHFSTVLVYLPTVRPLTSPTTLTFTLTPIIQSSP